MQNPVFVSRRKLLKQVHIPKLQCIVLTDKIVKPKKKPVLIKVIIYDLLAEVYEQLIVKHPIQCSLII